MKDIFLHNEYLLLSNLCYTEGWKTPKKKKSALGIQSVNAKPFRKSSKACC